MLISGGPRLSPYRVTEAWRRERTTLRLYMERRSEHRATFRKVSWDLSSWDHAFTSYRLNTPLLERR